MRTLLEMLREADEGVLVALTTVWGVKQPLTDTDALLSALNDTMLEPQNAERVWESLADNQRQALQTLLGSGGRMSMPMFRRVFGDIRRMGRGAVEREQPYKNPQSPAEALFYKGLMAETFQLSDKSDKGSEAYAYVPEDLALVLPRHKTAYDDLPDEEPDALSSLDVEELSETRPADTTIVDDMATLLAFLQLYGPPLDDQTLAYGSLEQLLPHLLMKDPARVSFMLMVGIDAELMEVQNGRVFVRRADARRWLEASRAQQVEGLLKAWLESTLYRELWRVPGLTIERAEGYDPRSARRAAFAGMRGFVPEAEWWDVDEFIYSIKQAEPDFQRPGGDYDSWYIQDIGGEYVRGFESWDTVEAALLEFLIQGTMHWLGLVDIAPEAARLTAYGRGALQLTDFPKPKDPEDSMQLSPDGVLVVSRKITRIDRFQVARFTAWEPAPNPDSGEPYRYRLTAHSIAQADAQGINTGHIRSFLSRITGDQPMPERVERLLSNWRGGDAAAATIEELLVLRTTSSEVLDDLVNTPEIRRFLGARLGPNATVVRRDQWEPLVAALAEIGMEVSLRE